MTVVSFYSTGRVINVVENEGRGGGIRGEEMCGGGDWIGGGSGAGHVPGRGGICTLGAEDGARMEFLGFGIEVFCKCDVE